MAADFRPAINAYLATTPPSVTTRTLADLIAFNRAHAEEELRYAGQQTFEQAEASAGKEQEWNAVRSKLLNQAREEGIDALLKKNGVDALIAPSFAPAWTNDLVNGDHVLGGIQELHAIGGYPHLTVPMGQVMGLPVGLSFIGPRWSDASLLSYGVRVRAADARASAAHPVDADGWLAWAMTRLAGSRRSAPPRRHQWSSASRLTSSRVRSPAAIVRQPAVFCPAGR